MKYCFSGQGSAEGCAGHGQEGPFPVDGPDGGPGVVRQQGAGHQERVLGAAHLLRQAGAGGGQAASLDLGLPRQPRVQLRPHQQGRARHLTRQLHQCTGDNIFTS